MAPSQARSQGKHWCFTINNFDDADERRLTELYERGGVRYIVFGSELGESGTPHLQGFVTFADRKRFTQVRNAIGERAHIERALGTPWQAAEYCKKDGEFVELGTAPPGRGARTDMDRFKLWVTDRFQETGRRPSERDVANSFPQLFVRYRRNLLDLVIHICGDPVMQLGDMRGWQTDLRERLEQDAEDRVIHFYVDEQGGTGKSWFTRWFLTQHPEKTQMLGIGKRDDLAHAIDISKSIFLFNVPRGGMEHLQYTVLEQLKDRMIFSPKYCSTTKLMETNVHVVVFCNEEPDYGKMSADRYRVVMLD